VPGEEGAELYQHEELSFDHNACDWVRRAAAEHHACRNGVALFDLSSFGKVVLSGGAAEELLEWTMSCPVATCADGRVSYTQMLNGRGGIESDLTMVPLPPEDPLHPQTCGRAFYLVHASTACTRDVDHLRLSATQMAGSVASGVAFQDVTDDFAVLALMGPQSRRLLGRVLSAGEAELTNEAFPFGTMRHLEVVALDGAPMAIRALRVSFVGELGWELHAPRELAGALFDALHASAVDAGMDGSDDFNDGELVNAGYRALLESLRLEKGFVHFGHDVSPVETPLEAGLGFVSAGKLKAGTPFCGRDALLRQKEEGVRQRLMSFSLGGESAGVSLCACRTEARSRNAARPRHTRASLHPPE
jgi:4-methylaminobutanoate oxidase (formaldehyde-forming)